MVFQHLLRDAGERSHTGTLEECWCKCTTGNHTVCFRWCSVHANNARVGGQLKIRAADLLGEITRLGFYFYVSLSAVCKLLWIVKAVGFGF